MAGSALIELVDRSLLGRADRPALEVEAADGAGANAHVRRRRGPIEPDGARARRPRPRPGDRLAVQLANRLEFLDLFLGALKLGAVFVPVNVLYREREVGAHRLRRGARGGGHDQGTGAARPAGRAGVGRRRARGGGGAAPTTLAGRRSRSPPTHPAAIVYTSGTTGRAKGAVLTPREPRRQRAHARRGVADHRGRPLPRRAAALPRPRPRRTASCCWLASGCRMRLVARFEHERAEALFEEFRPTLFFGVPTVYVRLLELPGGSGAGAIGARTAPLRVRLGAAAGHRVRGLPCPVRPRDPRALRHDRDADDDRQPVRRRAAAGHGRPSARRRRDPHRRPRRPGRRGRRDGRAAGAGPAVFAGYWRRPDATAARVRRRLVPHRRPRLARRPTATSRCAAARAS